MPIITSDAAASCFGAAYGQQTLLLAAAHPLSHSRRGRDCLTALGHDAVAIGAEEGPLPGTVYNSVGPDGRIYRIATAYVASDGRAGQGILSAMWDVLRGADQGTLVVRISYWDESPKVRREFDERLAGALSRRAESGAMSIDPPI